jgi:Secretion system C-terminal sorting domain
MKEVFAFMRYSKNEIKIFPIACRERPIRARLRKELQLPCTISQKEKHMKDIFRSLFVVFCLFTATNPLHAQWIQTNGPNGGQVYSFAVYDTYLFAGTGGGGVYLSDNDGASWTAIDNGLPANTYVYSLAVLGTNLYAATNGNGGGVYCYNLAHISSTSWTTVNDGLPPNTVVYALLVSAQYLFAGTAGGGVFRLDLTNQSWSPVNNGLTSTNVNSLAVFGANLFAGTDGGGVYLSTNNGTSWTPFNTGLTNTSTYCVLSLAVSAPNLFAGTYGGSVWRRALSETTSVVRLSTDLPAQFSLDQNYPNPFNPSTTIRYSLPTRSSVRIVITNTLGQQVAVLENGERGAGYHEVEWSPNVASGIYFYRIVAMSVTDPSSRFAHAKKMLFLK